MYVGLGAAHKNIDFMVRAFLATNTEKKLVICGKGHHLINSDRIIYTGYIEDKYLDYLYRNCSAFIFPSIINTSHVEIDLTFPPALLPYSMPFSAV
mgnify:CR=1 FL=1